MSETRKLHLASPGDPFTALCGVPQALQLTCDASEADCHRCIRAVDRHPDIRLASRDEEE